VESPVLFQGIFIKLEHRRSDTVCICCIVRNVHGRTRNFDNHSCSGLTSYELNSRGNRSGSVGEVGQEDDELTVADSVAAVAEDLSAARADLVKRRSPEWVAEGYRGLQQPIIISLSVLCYVQTRLTYLYAVCLSLAEPEEATVHLLRALAIASDDDARAWAVTE